MSQHFLNFEEVKVNYTTVSLCDYDYTIAKLISYDVWSAVKTSWLF